MSEFIGLLRKVDTRSDARVPFWTKSDGQLRASPPYHSGRFSMASATAMAARNGSTLFATGRIENLEELCAPPGKWGGVRGDEMDALLEIIDRNGIQSLRKLRGAFSLVLWNRASESLTLVSDQLGIHPIFYAHVNEGVAFSSSLHSLLAAFEVSRAPDEVYLACMIGDVVPDADATPFRSIKRVPAASLVGITPDGAVAKQAYWSLDWERRIAHGSDADYVDQGRALLDQAVRRKILGLDPVVCELSGGFDSSAVAATAARLCAPGKVYALTAAPPAGVPVFEQPNRVSDETPLAVATAALHPNMVWSRVGSSSLHAFDHDSARVFQGLGMPLRNVLNVGWFGPLYERARQLGARAVLTGSVGNMTLSWNGSTGLSALLGRGQWRRFWQETTALSRTLNVSPLRVLNSHLLLPLMSPRLQAWLRARRRRDYSFGFESTAIHPAFLRSSRIIDRVLDAGHGFAGSNTDARRSWLRSVQCLPPVQSALHRIIGVERRDPTGDIDLLEFCFAIPEEQYLRNGTTRWLARRVLSDRLPPQVLRENRRGFQCPEFLYRVALQREAILEALSRLEESPLAMRVLDLPRMREIAKSLPEAGTAELTSLASTTAFTRFGAVLSRGVHFGQYLRFMETGSC